MTDTSTPKGSTLTDEDIEDSIIAQYLDVWINRRKLKEASGKSYYNNIILFDDQNPENLKNKVLNFDPNAVKPILELSNLELSSLVPVIEIFKVYKNKNGKEIELQLPFPDYTYKDDLEQIFQTRTGRGAGVGIKNFSWNSMAKNQSNLAQFSAKMELYAQDPGELVKIRNKNQEGLTVSLVDLLYPSNRDANNLKANTQFDPNSFFIKIKVGWQLDNKKEPLHINKNSLNALVSEYYLTLYKHSINFNADGTLKIDIEFIAMAEALLDDQQKSDILFPDFVDEKTEAVERQYKDQIVELNKQRSEENVDKSKIDEKLKELKDKLAEITLTENRKKNFIYSSFLSWLNTNDLVEYIKVSGDEKVAFETMATFDSKYLNFQTSLELQEIIKGSTKNVAESNSSQPDLKHLEKTTGGQQAREIFDTEDKYKVEPDKVVEEYENAIKQRYELKEGDSGGSIFVPYFYLGDMLEYFFGRYTDIRSKGPPTKKNIKNKKVRLALGTFSYSDFGNMQICYQNGGVQHTTKTIKLAGGKKEEKTINLQPTKKIANIAHIPISIKSFMRWFNSKIVDSNLEKYSVNRFVRDVIYNLVPSNLSNKILRVSPPIKLNCSMNSDSIDDNDKLNGFQTMSEYLDAQYALSQNYIIKFDEASSFGNPFVYIKSRKAEVSTRKSINDAERDYANYIFLFSTNEYNKNLSKDADEDFKNNIFHFFIGEEKGIVKEIKFTREDNARLDAHNIQVANNGNTSSSLIRAVYNAEIEFFGNTIFTPGMLLFVSPTYPGMRLNDPLLFDLGLGGYYMVLEVNSSIESGRYGTSVKTKWQSFGIDPSKIRYEDLTRERIDQVQAELQANGTLDARILR